MKSCIKPKQFSLSKAENYNDTKEWRGKERDIHIEREREITICLQLVNNGQNNCCYCGLNNTKSQSRTVAVKLLSGVLNRTKVVQVCHTLCLRVCVSVCVVPLAAGVNWASQVQLHSHTHTCTQLCVCVCVLSCPPTKFLMPLLVYLFSLRSFFLHFFAHNFSPFKFWCWFWVAFQFPMPTFLLLFLLLFCGQVKTTMRRFRLADVSVCVCEYFVD